MNDSILRGAQLFEIASADLRATSEHGKEIHTSLVDENHDQTRFQFDNHISVGIGRDRERSEEIGRELPSILSDVMRSSGKLPSSRSG